MGDTIKTLMAALQQATDALDEFRTRTSKSYNPSDIDEICDRANDTIHQAQDMLSRGGVVAEITWQDVQLIFPSLSKEDCVEFMIINRSDVIAQMKAAALRAIQEKGTLAHQ